MKKYYNDILLKKILKQRHVNNLMIYLINQYLHIFGFQHKSSSGQFSTLHQVIIINISMKSILNRQISNLIFGTEWLHGQNMNLMLKHHRWHNPQKRKKNHMTRGCWKVLSPAHLVKLLSIRISFKFLLV